MASLNTKSTKKLDDTVAPYVLASTPENASQMCKRSLPFSGYKNKNIRKKNTNKKKNMQKRIRLCTLCGEVGDTKYTNVPTTDMQFCGACMLWCLN